MRFFCCQEYDHYSIYAAIIGYGRCIWNLGKLYSRHIHFYCKKLTQGEVGYGLLNVAEYVIPLFNTGRESNKLPRIDKYSDSCLNRTQFVNFLTDLHSPLSVLAIRRSIGNLAQKF